MPTPTSSSQAIVRGSALIAALLLLLALAMRWQHEPVRLHPSAVLFVALGFATFAALVWAAGRRMRRLESDKQELAHDYRTILDAAPEGVIVFDRAGVITLATDRAEELFGYAPGKANDTLAIFGLAFGFSMLPGLLIATGGLFLLRYPISRKKQDVIRKRLQQRAARLATA